MTPCWLLIHYFILLCHNFHLLKDRFILFQVLAVYLQDSSILCQFFYFVGVICECLDNSKMSFLMWRPFSYQLILSIHGNITFHTKSSFEKTLLLTHLLYALAILSFSFSRPLKHVASLRPNPLIHSSSFSINSHRGFHPASGFTLTINIFLLEKLHSA